MWLVGVGGIYGCGCKEVYRFHHTTYPYSSCICSFLQQLEEELEEECQIRFFTSCSASVNCAIIAMLYTHSIGNQPP